VFRRVMLSLPDGDLVREFMYLKYSFDSTLTSIEKTLYDDKLHDDYTKILEDLYEHEEKINELRKGRTILTSHLGSREYYTKVLKLQEFCRSIAG